MYALNCVYIFLVALLDSSDEDTTQNLSESEKKEVRRVLAKYEPLIEYFSLACETLFF